MHDYFLVQFSNKNNYLYILVGGPWTIFIYCLTIQSYDYSFKKASKNIIKRAIIWVCSLDLSLELNHSRILQAMGNIIGITIKIKYNMQINLK
jgi:hypothetical protein